MLHFLLIWFLSALAFIITAYLVPGIKIKGMPSALLAAAFMGLVNVLVRPVLLFLTFPITILTLGLFLLVVNALCLMLVGALTPGLVIRGFWWAVLGAVVLSLVSGFLHWVIPV